MAFNYSSLFLSSSGILQTPKSSITETSFTSGGPPLTYTNFHLSPGKYVLSGALTANTYATVVDISGKGVLYFGGAGSVDATSRTITSRILIDGVELIEGASTIAATNTGFSLAGVYHSTLAYASMVLEPFNSLKIEVKSDITETDKIFVKYMVATV